MGKPSQGANQRERKEFEMTGTRPRGGAWGRPGTAPSAVPRPFALTSHLRSGGNKTLEGRERSASFMRVAGKQVIDQRNYGASPQSNSAGLQNVYLALPALPTPGHDTPAPRAHKERF